MPSGTPVLLPSLLASSGTNLANRPWWWGCGTPRAAAARSVPGLNACHRVGWLPFQRFDPMLLRRWVRITDSTAVLRVCASAAAAAITTDTFTPRSAVPRLSSEISSLPEASFADQFVVGQGVTAALAILVPMLARCSVRPTPLRRRF